MMLFRKGWVENRISLQKLSKNWLTTSPNGVNTIWSSTHEVEASSKQQPIKNCDHEGKENVMSVAAERGQTVTVVACVSATGVFMPPYVIFKGKNLKRKFRDGTPPRTAASMSKSGYITAEIFNDFIKNFVSHKLQGNKPNILLHDGHSTHVRDPDTLQYALDNNVIMISIPPHTSHYIQPLDRSFFRSLEIHHYGTCNSWIKQNPARGITKVKFGMLLSQAWEKACLLC
jgi:hypothetical protein